MTSRRRISPWAWILLSSAGCAVVSAVALYERHGVVPHPPEIRELAAIEASPASAPATAAARELPLVKTCGSGNEGDCTELAELEEVSGNRDAAKWLYVRMCREGRVSACLRLSELQEAEGNFEAAKAVLDTPCYQGSREACEASARLVEARPELASLVAFPSEPEARSQYKDDLQGRCAAGHVRSCFVLGSIHKLDGEAEAATRAWSQACDAGFVSACAALGKHLSRTGDVAEAKHALERACSRDDAPACEELARLEQEVGDYRAAHVAALLACRLGAQSSCALDAELERAPAATQ